MEAIHLLLLRMCKDKKNRFDFFYGNLFYAKCGPFKSFQRAVTNDKRSRQFY